MYYLLRRRPEADTQGQVIRRVGDAREALGSHLRRRGDGQPVRGPQQPGWGVVLGLGEEDVVDAVLDLLLLLLLGVLLGVRLAFGVNGAELPRGVEVGAVIVCVMCDCVCVCERERDCVCVCDYVCVCRPKGG
jgi:hypothetical protein